MKPLTLYFVSFFCLVTAFSQKGDYQFKSFNSDYKKINDGIVLSNETPWGNFNQRFEIPLGFDYHFFDTSFDQVTLETSGRLVFDENHFYFADVFSAIGLQDRGFGSYQSLSPITYKDTLIGERSAIIIQFENAGLKMDSKAVINFQIWLFEKESKIELHMGDSFVSDFEKSFSYGPYFSIYHLKSISPLDVYWRFGTTGKKLKQVYSQSGKNVNILNNVLQELPPKGTVYSINKQ